MWNPKNSITEADVILAAKNGTLKSLRIEKNGEKFHVCLCLTWRKEELFLSTTRNRKRPRQFHHLGRLVEYIESSFPGIEAILLLLKPEFSS
jgi:hypothetical protein